MELWESSETYVRSESTCRGPQEQLALLRIPLELSQWVAISVTSIIMYFARVHSYAYLLNQGICSLATHRCFQTAVVYLFREWQYLKDRNGALLTR
jgi:hypothetical protein